MCRHHLEYGRQNCIPLLVRDEPEIGTDAVVWPNGYILLPSSVFSLEITSFASNISS